MADPYRAYAPPSSLGRGTCLLAHALPDPGRPGLFCVVPVGAFLCRLDESSNESGALAGVPVVTALDL